MIPTVYIRTGFKKNVIPVKIRTSLTVSCDTDHDTNTY